MINKSIICGRLGRDPEFKTLSSGSPVCHFTLAVQRTFKDRDGKQGVDWIPVVVWGNSAEHCSRYLSKGRLVNVVGRIQVRSYEDREGKKRSVTEIVAEEVQFLPQGEAQPRKMEPEQYGFSESYEDEDVPF